jgi:hypothetical protein
MIMNNCTVKFGTIAGHISTYFVNLIWQNTGPILASGSSVPTTLFQAFSSSGRFNTITLRNLDLSQLTGSLFTNASNSSIGTLTVQDIVRTGGAVDPTGQAQSRKIVTSADAQWLRPFKAEPMAIYNATTGSSVTATVRGTINAGALPNNDDIWAEFEYLGTSGNPLGTIVTTTKASVLASSAAVASDSSTWAVPSLTTWDSGTTTAVTLSGGNLVVTSTSATVGGARVAGEIRTTGKYYFEITYTNLVGNAGLGIGTPASTYANMDANATVGNMMFNSGNIYSNGSFTGLSLSTRSTSQVIYIAVDLDNRKIWFKANVGSGAGSLWNGTGGADPATNVSGVTVPAGGMVPFCTSASSGNVYTANFGASAFTGLVPSGFTSGWPNAFTSFKLATTITPQLPGYIHARVRAAKISTTYYIDPKITLT